MILVITHNGKLPSQGGKRIGYQCGDTLFSLATCQTHSVSALLAQRAKPQTPPEKQLTSYWDMEYCWLHKCNRCGSRDTFEEAAETDAGSRILRICRKCGYKMR